LVAALVKQWALKQQPGMATDSQTLLAAANCYQCYSGNTNELLLIIASLLAANAPGPTDAKTLLGNSFCTECYSANTQELLLIIAGLLKNIAGP
jgi:hypothetical protein